PRPASSRSAGAAGATTLTHRRARPSDGCHRHRLHRGPAHTADQHQGHHRRPTHPHLRGSLPLLPPPPNFGGVSLVDGVDIRPSEFNRKLPNATTHPTTSQPSAGRFAEAYAELLTDHSEVISIHISEKLSGTYASAVQGAEMTDSKRVHVID